MDWREDLQNPQEMKADVGRGSATGLRIRLGICNGGVNGLFKVFEHNHNRILKSLFCVSAKLHLQGLMQQGYWSLKEARCLGCSRSYFALGYRHLEV